MTPTLLRWAGEALYGPRWQTGLAVALDVADRTVRRWISGQSPVPESVVAELDNLLAHREAHIASVRERLSRR